MVLSKSNQKTIDVDSLIVRNSVSNINLIQKGNIVNKCFKGIYYMLKN